MDYRRLHAERIAELDEALLRDLTADKVRLANRLQLTLGEIEGLGRAIEELLLRLHERETEVTGMRATLQVLAEQERELSADRARWLRVLGVAPGAPRRTRHPRSRGWRVLRAWPGRRLLG